MNNFLINDQYGTQIEKNGQIVKRSRNLRGIVDYSRVSVPARVELIPVGKSSGSLRVIFADGASTRVNFASYSIMVDWVRNRRCMRHANIKYYGGNMGYLTKPGIIGGEA
jgi:hypothetical protein